MLFSPTRHEPHYYAVFGFPVGFYAEIGVVAAFRMFYAALPVYGIGNAEFVIADHVILPVRSLDVFFAGPPSVSIIQHRTSFRKDIDEKAVGSFPERSSGSGGRKKRRQCLRCRI